MSSRKARQSHGRWIRCPGGYRAYLPEPLPPPIEWSAELAVALSAADRALGRLAGEGRRLANPHLLIRPIVRREAEGDLFVRSGPGTVRLSPDSAAEYVRTRFAAPR